jgi:hypothetical protein
VNFTASQTGYYCFGAYYSGDSNYSASSDTSTAECYDVQTSASTTTSTPQHASFVLGGHNTDGAVVTGDSSGSPTGTVTFYECGPTPSPTSCTSQANEVGTAVAVTAGAGDTATAQSASFTPHTAGYYCFGAYYSGDSNYVASADTSTDECFDVTVASTTTVSAPSSPGAPVGGNTSDNASVAGNTTGKAPTGTVSFYECGPTATPAPCTSQAHQVGTADALTAGAGDVSFASSATFTPGSTGYYCFGAYYSGDSNYAPSSDTSTDECVDVVNPPTITSFTPHTGAPGMVVTITGTNLLNATSVVFGTAAGAIKKDSATKIKVIVPAGAKNAKIKVTTYGGTVKTATNFTVS